MSSPAEGGAPSPSERWEELVLEGEPGGELLLGELLSCDPLLEEEDEEGGVLDGDDGAEGGAELGMDGGCGVVGLLALGQPLRSRHAAVSPTSLINRG